MSFNTGVLPKWYLANCSDQQNMGMTLDNIKVTAKSDGGLSFQPNPKDQCMYPVFSIEVFPRPYDSQMLIYQTKRQKYKELDNESTYQKHAAQIYAEMLGQVCHPECYADSRRSQEVNLPRATFLIPTRPLFSMYDTQHSTCSMQNSQINICRTSSSTVRIIGKWWIIRCKSSLNSPVHFACVILMNKPPFSSSSPMFYATS